MNPRDAVYSAEGMIDPYNYDLDGARRIALAVVSHYDPETVQETLERMSRLGYKHDDLNRRAVLSLLVEARLAIDRMTRRVRRVE